MRTFCVGIGIFEGGRRHVALHSAWFSVSFTQRTVHGLNWISMVRGNTQAQRDEATNIIDQLLDHEESYDLLYLLVNEYSSDDRISHAYSRWWPVSCSSAQSTWTSGRAFQID